MYQANLRKTDKNVLHGPKLSGEKITVWSSESKTKLVPQTKSIKNMVPNTNFSDVLFTAISSSLAEFFVKGGIINLFLIQKSLLIYSLKLKYLY